ncbi:hypothetical protein LSTR_LSTR014049 [Laodelphax striatellus]|uniref:Uncharacterized protein n=1 Tax=Laodelphax striatellus TaxID=195883 RepID=A0A482WLB7_LAOST|nr:hypothetical protein LSTR_LSTR014049 [Laodelphax striatellus]
MDLSIIYFRSAALLLIVFNHNINLNLGFNLEARIPIIKRGSTGSYFGYSVAEHQAVNEVTNKVEHNW